MLGPIIAVICIIIVFLLLAVAMYFTWLDEQKIGVVFTVDDVEVPWFLLMDEDGGCDG